LATLYMTVTATTVDRAAREQHDSEEMQCMPFAHTRG